MAVIYFIMQYPKVGHSFLRKEILALEPTNAMEEMPSAPYQRLIDMGEAAYLRVKQRHDINIEASKLAALFAESAR